MAATEPEIRGLMDRWSAAVRSKDIDKLMSLYSPDIVYYDVVPPLQISGSAAVRKNFERWFAGWKSGIGADIHDLHVQSSGDTAAAFKLHRTSGTLKDGSEVGYWVRVSFICRRSDRGWLITHEHVSLPTDFRTGSAVKDLEP
jgi:uncharacterized protein (TIGR02246 family)